jgi:ubiquinone biosynthesis protein
LATLACSVARSPDTLLLARALCGMFGGIAGGAVMTIAADVVPPERRGAAMGLVGTSFSAAAAVGVPFGLYLAQKFEWEAPFLVLAGLAMVNWILLWKFLPPVRGHLVDASSPGLKRFLALLSDANARRGLLFMATLVFGHFAIIPLLAPHLVGRIPIAALANPPALVELFAETIVEELDFRMEAANMVDVAAMLRELGQDGYVIPRPHPRLVTRRVLVMQRVYGFNFDDVAGMKDAGIDTEDVVRTAMVALMEGAMVYGVFHGDLHGGNLFVLADGRTALLDFGIVGRLTGERRLAFLRMMLAATTNDVKGQMAAMRDLGALPADTDLEAVIRDLRLDQPPIDPTTLSGEELVGEVQRVVKAMMGYGARMPKELMLYVKNMVFLDGAMARLAPDLDLIGEIAKISMMFAERHGERLGRELGIDHTAVELNMDGVKAGFGVDTATDSLTYRELQARRDLIQKRMRDHVGR